MATRIIWTCDRCGHSTTANGTEPPMHWKQSGKITLTPTCGPDVSEAMIVSPPTDRELCFDCADEVGNLMLDAINGTVDDATDHTPVRKTVHLDDVRRLLSTMADVAEERSRHLHWGLGGYEKGRADGLRQAIKHIEGWEEFS